MKKIFLMIVLLTSNIFFCQEISVEQLKSDLVEIDASLKMGAMQFMSIVMKDGGASKAGKDFWIDNAIKDSVIVRKATEIIRNFNGDNKEAFNKANAAILYKRVLRSGFKVMEANLDFVHKIHKLGWIDAKDYAVYYDIYCVRKGVPQKYGTQLWQVNKQSELYFLPIENPDKVDEFRVELGLKPLNQDFYKWDKEDYLKNLKKSTTFLNELKR